jgi:glycosyltransferase involved in cell wall biosynthesis
MIRALYYFIHCNKITNTKLVIAGDGLLRPKLESLVKQMNISHCVIFLGNIPHKEMPLYYAISDVVMATSTYSNMNLAVQEAMACGKPVVAFSAGNTKNIIKHMETGLLAEPGNSKKLADYLHMLYKNRGLRKRLGKNARNFIVENRNWSRRVQAELDIYRKILVED